MTCTVRGARQPALIDALVALADTLIDDYDVIDIDLPHQLVETSTHLLAADAAGILLSDGHGPAAGDDLPDRRGQASRSLP